MDGGRFVPYPVLPAEQQKQAGQDGAAEGTVGGA